ncbi:MAG: hypothetical protein ABIS09_06615, partial [Sphingomicrobium sp.]
MAQAFKPRFVDLVRNYTTTVGTGDFAPGPAVNGYSSFAAALSTGDSFYYSAIGVDKPAEREVGRGTLTSTGTISRDPISGTKTNFTSGAKSVALIAAAEWFDAADAMLGNATELGGSLLTAASAGDARAALGLGSASLLTSDADAGLASDSDSRVPTQRAVRAYAARFAVAHADRAALAAGNGAGAAMLREQGREGMFVFDGSNLSAKVTADTAQGLYVAPASDTTGASGAWVRKFNGEVQFNWFGGVEGNSGAPGANSTANNAAWTAAMSILSALKANALSNFSGLYALRFGLGTYEFSQALDIDKGAIDIRGSGMGHVSVSAVSGGTRLKFYDCGGLRVQSTNTSGISTGDAVLHAGGDQSSISDLGIEGNFSAAEAEYYGLHVRAQVHCRNIAISNFAGDAFRIEANTAGVLGNANSSTFLNCHGWGSRNGMAYTGNNTGQCVNLGGSFNNNREWGIKSLGTIGSMFFGIEIATAGSSAWNDGTVNPVSRVSDGTNRYFAISGQEVGASTNAPSGTTADNTWWAYEGAGATNTGIPLWFSGILVRSGGCAIGGGSNLFSGCYAESTGQAPMQGAASDVVLGGKLSLKTWANGKFAVIRGGSNGMASTLSCYQALSGTVDARLGDQNGNSGNRIWTGYEPTIMPFGLGGILNGTNYYLTYNGNLTTQVAYRVTGPTTSDQFGTGANVPYAFVPRALMVTDGSTAITTARQLRVDNAAPSTGAHGQGEFTLYRGSTAGLIGWNCTTAGSPGTWQALYSGYGTGNIGYVTGAGGTVTQATSKATGVTLNKLSGQVTMNAAALAASASAAFTLTNSQIAATDVVLVTIASGATSNSYITQVQATAAGSCSIQLRNVSAGSLSEAV